MPTTGSMIDALHTNREKRRALEKQIEKLNEEAALMERELLENMKAEGLDKATGKYASASVQEAIKPSVEDWELFHNYIKKTGYFHLLERRPSVTGCRELFETKGRIPGVLPVTLQKISLRNL